MANGQPGRTNVRVPAGGTGAGTISGAAAGVCRVDGTIFFDTAKSFIHPQYRPALEQAFAFGLTRPATGTGAPVQTPRRFMLIVGHTDHVGSAASNDRLSERRARATLAVFTVDASIWNDLYQTEHWDRTSGDTEIIEMFGAVENRSPSPAEITEIKSDNAKRLDLMERYLHFLRPDWLPQQSPPIRPALVTLPPLPEPILGCGFNHLRVPSLGDVQENRRAEFVYFQVADPGVRDCSAYRTWQATCGQFITVQIELQDEYGAPFVGQFDLTLPTGGILRNERTDSRGTWTRSNLPAGEYTVTVAGSSITLMR
jgi:hypothetical protein